MRRLQDMVGFGVCEGWDTLESLLERVYRRSPYGKPKEPPKILFTSRPGGCEMYAEALYINWIPVEVVAPQWMNDEPRSDSSTRGTDRP